MTEKYGGTTLPPFANATDHPVAVEDTSTIQEESLVPYPVINTEDTKPTHNMEEQRPLTFGEKAVGISFNPGKNPTVESIKHGYASIIDLLNDLRAESESPEAKRMLSIAITESQSAQMWAVKAVTWQY